MINHVVSGLLEEGKKIRDELEHLGAITLVVETGQFWWAGWWQRGRGRMRCQPLRIGTGSVQRAAQKITEHSPSKMSPKSVRE